MISDFIFQVVQQFTPAGTGKPVKANSPVRLPPKNDETLSESQSTEPFSDEDYTTAEEQVSVIYNIGGDPTEAGGLTDMTNETLNEVQMFKVSQASSK